MTTTTIYPLCGLRKKWGPLGKDVIQSLSIDYRHTVGLAYDGTKMMPTKEIKALVIKHMNCSTELMFSRHMYTVLSDLVDMGLLAREEKPLRFSLTKKGLRCGTCIANNR